jgi:chemotaxis protein CheX
MNVLYLNPFIDAANEILHAEVQTKAERGNLTLQKSAMTAEEITVLISMIGDIQGVVLFGMSIKTGLEMVSRMMGQTCTEFDNLAQSGIAELGNVISGRASINLSNAGIQTNISPPTMVIGKGVQISTLDFPRIVVPLSTEIGDLTVHLALREGQAGGATNPFPFSIS